MRPFAYPKRHPKAMGNILIVEDDPNIRKLVRVNLVKRGYTVSEAEDSHQAMARFQAEAVDLVLLDLVLPGLSGVDVCAWMRARSDVPIIVLSARSEEDLKVAALDAGADDYVTKPFGVRELLARIQALLRRTAPGAGAPPNGAARCIGPAFSSAGTRNM